MAIVEFLSLQRCLYEIQQYCSYSFLHICASLGSEKEKFIFSYTYFTVHQNHKINSSFETHYTTGIKWPFVYSFRKDIPMSAGSFASL